MSDLQTGVAGGAGTFDDIVSKGSMSPERRALLAKHVGNVHALLEAVGSAPAWRPLNWHVTIRGNVAYLSHGIADDAGPVWAGEVELWRGAPGFDSHPEIEHALRAIMNPIHREEFVRHTWVYDIPDHWGGAVNAGPNRRRYLLLTASGGLLNWSLVLKLPVGTPQFVWKAIAYGFKATLKGDTMPHPAGPSQTAKPASLAKGEVPTPDAPPPATKEGINSLSGPAKG